MLKITISINNLNQQIEEMPNDATLDICRKAWDLSKIVFVRKMENIVFSCQRQGKTVFLRLTTPLRRSRPQIEAELHFLSHLAEVGLRVPNVIQNNQAQSLMTLKDNSQQYEAVVFSQVTGEHPSEQLVVTANYLKSLGSLIATMHQVSQKYEPLSCREHWFDERGIRHALEAAKTTLHSQMREKLESMITWISTLEKTPHTYGLVHIDLGASNLFVETNNSIGIIDFDDSCYHFFAFDLAIVIYSMANRFAHSSYNPIEQSWANHLIEGYRHVRAISDEEIKQIPRFIDFACLRLYFWIEYHENLKTFHNDAIERVLKMKQWSLERVNGNR